MTTSETPSSPGPFPDVPTYRIPVTALPGVSAPNVAHWSQRAARCADPTGAPRRADRPNPTLAGDLASLAFDPPVQLLGAIPAQRTASATESAG